MEPGGHSISNQKKERKEKSYEKWKAYIAGAALIVSIVSFSVSAWSLYRVEELTYLGSADLAAIAVIPRVVNVTDPTGELLVATPIKLSVVSRSSFPILFYSAVVDMALSTVRVDDKEYGFESFCTATFGREREADPSAWQAEPYTVDLGPNQIRTIFVLIAVNKMRFNDAVGLPFENFRGGMLFNIVFKLTQARTERTLDHDRQWFVWAIEQGRVTVVSYGLPLLS